MPADDDLVRAEAAAAARDAARIGGRSGAREEDPAQRAVIEAGGGESEGFEQAERDLIDNAQHGDGQGDPEADAFLAEAETDRAGVSYGEADELESSELGPG